MKRIINMIHKGEAKHIFKESLTKSHFLVPYKGEMFRVVYTKINKTIITFLPMLVIDDSMSVSSMDEKLVDCINNLIAEKDPFYALCLEKLSYSKSVWVVNNGEKWIKVHYHNTKGRIYDPENEEVCK